MVFLSCEVLRMVLVLFLSFGPMVIHCDDQNKRTAAVQKSSEYNENNMWQTQFEDELTEIPAKHKKHKNATRKSFQKHNKQSFGKKIGEIEKLLEHLTGSEKHLKKIDVIDSRLNRLDIEVHEKSNVIIKYLKDIKKELGANGTLEQIANLLKTVNNHNMYYRSRVLPKASNLSNDGALIEHAPAPSISRQFDSIEKKIHTILSGVESVVTMLSDAKEHGAKCPTMRTDQSDTMLVMNEFRKIIRGQKVKKCDCSKPVLRAERYPTDCNEILMQGFNISGIYKIKPDDTDAFYALCDLTTAGGGWTVIQNRFDGTQDFHKSWSDYKNGFGNLAGEFWLGLEKIHYITNQKLYQLRVDMETQRGLDAFATYSVFAIGSEDEGYRISTLGAFYGTSGDSLSYHAGQKFSTFDADNDEWNDGSCAMEHGGAWWYKECDKSNLNGKYATNAEEASGQTIYWISFKGPTFPLTKTKMMVRPLPASRPKESVEHLARVKFNRFLE